MKGQLRPDYSITCGICEDGEYVGAFERPKAAKAAHAAGWKRTKAHGWIGKRCAEESKRVQALSRAQ